MPETILAGSRPFGGQAYCSGRNTYGSGQSAYPILFWRWRCIQMATNSGLPPCPSDSVACDGQPDRRAAPPGRRATA